MTNKINDGSSDFEKKYRSWPFGWLLPKKTPPPYKDQPCFVVERNGEVLNSTLRTYSGGQMAIQHLGIWREAYPDGSVHKECVFAKKWFLP